MPKDSVDKPFLLPDNFRRLSVQMSIKLMDFLPLSIEQDHQQSPRSTVGTITEIYDFLRLLYARAADDSYNREKMVSYSDEQI
jgi:excinuclease UvrABC ATPase subunit